jgi:hypothetical protein
MSWCGGDSDVARSVAENRGARISELSFFQLVKRAETDGILAEKVRLRPASAPPGLKGDIQRVLDKVPGEVDERDGLRDFHAAQRVVLILCKAAGLSWPTVKSVIAVRPDGKAASSPGADSTFADYGRLSASTAQRVVRFWQVRPSN